ncbi:MAG TPA: MarR family transcriptional regulator, partial [Dehalococcoidia bacterium]|nr:MarR family transcriptional regulator [Dehalococcoidia bacterium]
DGLVERMQSELDRRVNLARLTEKGAETFHTVLPVMSQRMTDACASFSDDDKDRILRLLQLLS